LRLLDIPEHVHEAVEFGIHRGVASAFTIVQLHYGVRLHGIVGLPTGTTSADLELLTSDFDATTNVVLGVVLVEEIFCNLP
jgi:hypothetical protein